MKLLRNVKKKGDILLDLDKNDKDLDRQIGTNVGKRNYGKYLH